MTEHELLWAMFAAGAMSVPGRTRTDVCVSADEMVVEHRKRFPAPAQPPAPDLPWKRGPFKGPCIICSHGSVSFTNSVERGDWYIDNADILATVPREE